jgi:glycosyltransferase involved in cell wall biosynthesis
MRILMLNYEYPPLGGGASPVTRDLCLHLANAGHEVDVVTMGFGRLPPVETFDNVRVIRVPALRRSAVRAEAVELLSYIAAALPPALALLRHRRYDVVHAHFIVPTGMLAAVVRQASGLPLVITAHGSDVPGYNPDRFIRAHRVIAPAWRLVARSADVIVSPSHYLRGLIQQACAQCRSRSSPTASTRLRHQPENENGASCSSAVCFHAKGRSILSRRWQECHSTDGK